MKVIYLLILFFIFSLFLPHHNSISQFYSFRFIPFLFSFFYVFNYTISIFPYRIKFYCFTHPIQSSFRLSLNSSISVRPPAPIPAPVRVIQLKSFGLAKGVVFIMNCCGRGMRLAVRERTAVYISQNQRQTKRISILNKYK